MPEERDPGALDAFTAFLMRLVAKVHEWEELRSMGAVLLTQHRFA